MPEGPELYLSAQFVNKVCHDRLFSGKVTKSEVSWKNPDVDWNYPTYTIRAESRGKEMKLLLTEVKNAKNSVDNYKFGKSMQILFRFGMSGKFAYTSTDSMDKHAHLHFYTLNDDKVLSFVDVRRFGGWEIDADWSDGRGPCIIQEGDKFRSNVLANLEDCAFNRPICEAMLNQKYFNGIGNYLRAEILYRLRIPPFECARKVLEKISTDPTVKREPDILDLCHTVPTEVINLGQTKYMFEPKIDPGIDTEKTETIKETDAFTTWLQCYYVKGMNSMADHNNRTIWFSGPAGPMAPSGQKSERPVKRSKKVKKENTKETTESVETPTEPSIKRARNSTTKVKVEDIKTEQSSDSNVEYSLPSTNGKQSRRKPPNKKTNVKSEPQPSAEMNSQRTVSARTKQRAKISETKVAARVTRSSARGCS